MHQLAPEEAYISYKFETNSSNYIEKWGESEHTSLI